MPKEDKILIPVNQLEEGFESNRIMIEMMLDSSEVLKNSNNFPLSIALSILALEEATKLELIHKKIMTSKSIIKSEWKKISHNHDAHMNKLVEPVKEENTLMKSLGKETYEEMKIASKKLGIGEMPNFEEILKVSDSNLGYYRILNTIKQDCLYLDWNNNNWVSFFYLPIEKQKAFANFRLVHTAQIIYNIILRNRLYQLSNNKSKEVENEFARYTKKLSEIEKILKLDEFKNYVLLTNDLLEDYVSLRLKKYIIDADDEEVTFSLKDIRVLPDLFFEMYVMTGILPGKLLTLRKQDIDLKKNTIKTGFDGCAVCRKPRESDVLIWTKHFSTNEHYGNAYAYFKSKFHLKEEDPILIRLKNIISIQRSKNPKL